LGLENWNRSFRKPPKLFLKVPAPLKTPKKLKEVHTDKTNHHKLTNHDQHKFSRTEFCLNRGKHKNRKFWQIWCRIFRRKSYLRGGYCHRAKFRVRNFAPYGPNFYHLSIKFRSFQKPFKKAIFVQENCLLNLCLNKYSHLLIYLFFTYFILFYKNKYTHFYLWWKVSPHWMNS